MKIKIIEQHKKMFAGSHHHSGECIPKFSGLIELKKVDFEYIKGETHLVRGSACIEMFAFAVMTRDLDSNIEVGEGQIELTLIYPNCYRDNFEVREIFIEDDKLEKEIISFLLQAKEEDE